MRRTFSFFWLLILFTSLSAQSDCTFSIDLQQSPFPVGGVYDEGRRVHFCLTISDWEFSSTAEWLHSIEISFGQGWDLNSLQIDSLPPEHSNGFWDWYNYWEGCNSGNVFGPGFAFESSSGTECVESTGVIDDDPGNNWGDSNPSNLGDPITFCWSLQTKTCSMDSLNDLGVSILVLTDSQSGSYDIGPCMLIPPPHEYPAELFCCTDTFDIVVNIENSQCGEPCTGRLEVSPEENLPIGTTFDFALFDSVGENIEGCQYCEPPFIVDDLCPGTYSILLRNKVDGTCAKKEIEVESSFPSSVEIISTYPEDCNFENPVLSVQFDDIIEYKWMYYGVLIGTDSTFSATDPGAYSLEATLSNGCVLRGEKFINPTPALHLSEGDTLTVCRDEFISIYAWGGIGVENVHWDLTDEEVLRIRPVVSKNYTAYGEVVNESGETCLIDKSVFVEVLPISEMHGLQCQSVNGGVLYTWDNISGQPFTLEADVLRGEQGIFSGNSYLVTGMDALTESIVVFGVTNDDSGCTNTYSIACGVGTACADDLTIEFNIPEDICQGMVPFPIDANIIGGSATDLHIWSGGGIVDTSLGVFNPGVAEFIASPVTLEVIQDSCYVEAQTIIEITAEVLPPVIHCEAENDVLTFQIESFPDYSVYDFDVNILTGQNPDRMGRTVKFYGLIPGEEVTMEVIALGGGNCTAFSEMTCSLPCDSITDPELSCYPFDDESIIFEWEVDTLLNYEPIILTGQTGAVEAGQLLVSGLSPGEEVGVVLAVSNSCGEFNNVSGSCNLDCSDIVISIPPQSICLGDTLLLEAMITGGNAGGDYQWSGACVEDAGTGIFDSDACGVGMYEVSLAYTLGSCEYMASGTVTVIEEPQAFFSLATQTPCQGEDVMINWDDNGGAYQAIWDFDGGVVVSEDPLVVHWMEVGEKEVSLLVANDSGCESNLFTQMINVRESVPLVLNCQSTTSSILWDWNEIPNAIEYEYQLDINGILTQGVLTELSFTVDGLSQDQEVTFTLTAIGDAVCSQPATLSCTTLNCPDYSLVIQSPGVLCDSGEAVSLVATIEGDNTQTGSFQWEGIGIVDAGLGIFNPSIAGTGMHTVTVTYTEQNCTYSASAVLEVLTMEELDIPSLLTVCRGTDFEFCLPDEYSYLWSSSNGFISQNHCLILPAWGGDPSGIYTVRVTNEVGCSIEREIVVEAIEDAIASATADPDEVCPYQWFELNVDVPASAEVHWFPHEYVLCSSCAITPGFTPSDLLYEVHVVDEFGCEWVDSVEVFLRPYCPPGPWRSNTEGNVAPGRYKADDNGVYPLEMNLFPNPVTDLVQIKWQGADEGELVLFSPEGEIVMKHPIQGGEEDLDCRVLPVGTYLLQLRFSSGVLIERLVVGR